MAQRVALYGCRAGEEERRERNKMHGNARRSALSRVGTIQVEIENALDDHAELRRTRGRRSWFLSFAVPGDCNREIAASHVNWSCTSTPPPPLVRM